jgi:UDP-N-acetylmuramoyl-L-alanyl-D-glutamate--2,6-diaminopimelate ligase
MKLSELLRDSPGASVLRDAYVTGIAYDSRAVKPGNAFFAIVGFKEDGRRYIPQALEKGASAVVTVFEPGGVLPDGTVLPDRIGAASVQDPRRALSGASAAFYGYPSRELAVVGITGTKGKTTTCHVMKSVLDACGEKSGLIGTVHNVVGDEERPVTRTTPESADLHSLHREMVTKGCTAVAMEVSSHALELCRVEDILFDAAVFTNMGWDHLDFHGTMESYAEAKARLFQLLGKAAGAKQRKLPLTAAINADDPYAELFAKRAEGRVVLYGLGQNAEVRAVDVAADSRGTDLTLVMGTYKKRIRTSLLGRFNVYNLLAAAATAYGLGFDCGSIARGLEAARGVRGRVELVDGAQPYSVWVDYAHTPESLRDILSLAREMAGNRVIAVVGCGGDRDKGRRPVMGKIAGDMADYTVLTDDNPRTEDPDEILDQIEEGIKASRGKDAYTRIRDRRLAINEAIERALPGDIVVLAGKGHETYQAFKDETVHFDDAEEARKAIRTRASKEGHR